GADDRELREQTPGALRQAGYRVVSARNEARALLSVLKRPPSLVLLDMSPADVACPTFVQNAAAAGMTPHTFGMDHSPETRPAAPDHRERGRGPRQRAAPPPPGFRPAGHRRRRSRP